MRRGTRTWVGRALAAAMLALALGYIPYHLYARSGLARTLALRRELDTIRMRNADLRSENIRLAREAEALRSDLAAVEQVARKDLGWVRPGEVVFQIQAADPGAAGDPAARAPRVGRGWHTTRTGRR